MACAPRKLFAGPPAPSEMSRVDYLNITTQEQLGDYCNELAQAAVIGFDTEFIAENTYHPQLCLIQVQTAAGRAIIDPIAIGDVDLFWQTLVEGEHTTVVHAGREEFRFCQRATGRRPNKWFDTQIAAALVGGDYPAAYHSLVSRLLGQSLGKGETRTDWRRRPLSRRQLEYALQDVAHLLPLYEKLNRQLESRGRKPWLQEELERWQSDLESLDADQRWRRVSGISGLSPRGMAIARELWRYREAEAERRDKPPKRILRDDLIAELARRGAADEKRIAAVRGFERRDLRRQVPEIARHIERALALPAAELPKSPRATSKSQLTVLAQFLNTALASRCRSMSVAPSLVGTVNDVRELVADRLGMSKAGEPTPRLSVGWRVEVVGRLIEDLLAGKTCVRVTNPRGDDPLSFEQHEG